MGPSSSCLFLPIAATAALRPIIAMTVVEIMERLSRPTPDLGQDIFRGPPFALLGQNARGLRGHAFAARRVIAEELAQMQVSDLAMMNLQRLPDRTLSEG